MYLIFGSMESHNKINLLTLVEVDADHQVWKNVLNDMKDELLEMESRLGLCSDQVKIEHFQNQFIVHRNAIDEIKNGVQKCKLHSEQSIGSCFDYIDDQKYNFHQQTERMLSRQEELFKELKTAFNELISPR